MDHIIELRPGATLPPLLMQLGSPYVRPFMIEGVWLHMVIPCTHAGDTAMNMREACHQLCKVSGGNNVASW